jgi:putative acetyltransferase
VKRLETKRLILRSWTLEDAADLYDYAKLDTVGPKAGWNPHESIAESVEILKRFIAKDDVWALEFKANNKVIGSVGIHEIDIKTDLKAKELGYVLSTEYENMGLMTEACQMVLSHVFSDTDTETLYVTHFLGNHRSQRVIEKCGFSFLDEIEYKCINDDIRISRRYILTKSKYSSYGGES